MPRYPTSLARSLQWERQQLLGAFCDYTSVIGFVIFHHDGALCVLLRFVYFKSRKSNFFTTAATYTTGTAIGCVNPTHHSRPLALWCVAVILSSPSAKSSEVRFCQTSARSR